MCQVDGIRSRPNIGLRSMFRSVRSWLNQLCGFPQRSDLLSDAVHLFPSHSEGTLDPQKEISQNMQMQGICA